MSLLPALGISGLIQAGSAAAGTAVSTVSQTFSLLLHGATGQTPPGGVAPSTPPAAPPAQIASGADLPDRLRNLADILRSHLNQLLSEQGIDPPATLTLQRDATGGIRVADGHPQAAEIEALLAAHPELGDMFTAIEQNARQQSPASAPQTFQLVLTDDDAQATFVPSAAELS